jgi:hypothetical protein
MVEKKNHPRKREGGSGAAASFLLSQYLGEQRNDGQPNRPSEPESVEPELNGVLFKGPIKLLPGLLLLDHRCIHSGFVFHCPALPVSVFSRSPTCFAGQCHVRCAHAVHDIGIAPQRVFTSPVSVMVGSLHPGMVVMAVLG